MPAKKDSGTARYKVLRDHGESVAGDVVELEPDQAALLVRDGMIQAEEG